MGKEKPSAAKKRTGAEALVESLSLAGADTVFGYPGGNVVDVFDALASSPLRFVLGRHEQGCVHMADGYARSLGKVGVVVVTSGPGLTNAITGLGTANIDSVPLVLICGQVPLCQMGTDAFQESDTTGLTRAVTKHNFLVKRADEIPRTVAEAFFIATHGKPGTVVIDVPKDVQEQFTSARYPAKVTLRAYHPERAPVPRDVRRLARLLNEAERPLIYAGGGVISSGASDDVVALARKTGAPVATTMMGIGVISAGEGLSLGMSGVHGTARANYAMAGADLVLALGVRFNDRATGTDAFAPSRASRIVHVDCDPSSIGKNVRVKFGITADVRELLAELSPLVKTSSHGKWLDEISSVREKAPPGTKGKGTIHPSAVVAALSAYVTPETTVVTDVGQHQLWVVRGLGDIRPRRFLAPGGMGTMGFAVPAAIGAALARDGEKVISFVGDGGAQMTFEEIIVAAERSLPVVFVVFENRTLGLVRQMQLSRPGAGAFATEMRCPDFVRLASAYGVKAYRASDEKSLEKALSLAVRARGPVLVEVMVDAEADV